MNSGEVIPDAQDKMNQVKKVLIIIFFFNIAVALAKFIYGVISKSAAMQADGLHSIFDSAGNVVAIIGITFASMPADKSHPYGHGKFETYASAFIGILLTLAGINIFSNAVKVLVSGQVETVVTPISFVVIIFTLIINIFVTVYEHKQAKKYKSDLLGADALHTLSDVIVSISVIISLILVSLGFELADPFVSLLVAAAIFYSAWEIFKKANSTLSDQARIASSEIYDSAIEVSGVKEVHAIRTRGSNDLVYADLHVLVDPEISVYLGHEIAVEVEQKLKDDFDVIRDVVVHIEPYNTQQLVKGDDESV
ncbi:MAG: cation diffusion facilitator family transporter [Coriobacteriia bacterium]|nr:cation diffusion facilitator family transporter [Coriobacteriia bacterium]